MVRHTAPGLASAAVPHPPADSAPAAVVPERPLAGLVGSERASAEAAPPLLAADGSVLEDVPPVADAAQARTDSRVPGAPFAALTEAIEGVDPVELLLWTGGVLITPPAQPQPPGATTDLGLPLPAAPAAAALARPLTGPQGTSVFDHAQVVSFYGYPGIGVMGELGLHSPEDAAAAITRVAAEYDALNGPRDVIPALHLIVGVAQRNPGSNGLYLLRMDEALLNAYVEAAREANILLFVDVQIGWSDALTEVMLLEDALREPFVHLAIDPEFMTRSSGTAPGVSIGSLGADDVNAVQHYLAGLVREHDLPPKVLVLHQFLTSMLTGVEWYDDVPEVEVTVDMDGFGSPHVKLTKYDLFAVSDYAERAAIKLFYHWDAPLLTPAQLISLDNPPDLVIYQ